MEFDVKDIKSWTNRHDVKIGDEGYVANGISQFRELNIDDAKCGKVTYIDDNWNLCFKSDLDPFTYYAFFLPLKKVKKEKKYRPIKNMAELADIMYGEDRQRVVISTGDLMTLERKKDRFRFRILITQLEYDHDLQLVSINDKTLKNLFDDYNVMNVNGIFVPFGVEVKND